MPFGKKCPVCNNSIIKKKTKENKTFYKMLLAFKSIGTTCENCQSKLMCGFIGNSKITKASDFIIITEKEYLESMKTIKDKTYSFNHVNERLKERFNISPITMEEYNSLNNKLQSNKNNRILIENEDQEIHQMLFKELKVAFVFSVNRGYITTVLKW